MRAFISISRTWLIALVIAICFFKPVPGWAQSAFDDLDEVKSSDERNGDSEDDFRETPFTKYGEFNEEDDEAAAELFFRFGRFFGASLGVGVSGATGNRGKLWSGGFPAISVKLHYWFDFHFALDIEFASSSHSFTDTNSSTTDVGLTVLATHLKYYIDTTNLSAALTFASPYLLLGGGAFTKSETNASSNQTDTDGKFGVTLGVGLEFVINPKKVYFDLESKFSFVNFTDRNSTDFAGSGISDLTGTLYVITGNILFTW